MVRRTPIGQNEPTKSSLSSKSYQHIENLKSYKHFRQTGILKCCKFIMSTFNSFGETISGY